MIVAWVALASAAVPVQLPAGEDRATWAPALALADLEPATSGATVTIDARGGKWLVTAREGAASRSATVARPTTPEQREDLVWLIVSLRSALTAPAPLPEPVAPAPRRAAPRPPPPPPVPTEVGTTIGDGVPVGTPPIEPEPEPEPPPRRQPPPKPEPDPELELDDLAPPPHIDEIHEVAHLVDERELSPAKVRWPTAPRPERAGPWLRVSGAVALQPGAGARPLASVALGASRKWWAIGGRGGWGPGRALALGSARRWSSFELGLEAWARSDVVNAGITVGADIRSFYEGTEVVAQGAMPYLRGELALGVHLGHRLVLEPGLAARVDLGFTELRVDGDDAGSLPGQSLAPSLALRWR